jgi:hypothetical protein
MKYFIIVCNYPKFPIGTIVEYQGIINEVCYLVKKINSCEIIWIMKYELYPIIEHDSFSHWSYNISYQKLIPSKYYIIKNNKKIVKILNNNINYDDCVVLDINTNTELKINYNELIQASKYK